MRTSWQAAGWLGIAASACLLGCSHAAPPPARRADGDAALAAKARADLGPDPFRALDAGAPAVASAARPAPVAPAPPDPRAEADAALRKALQGDDCAAMLEAISANPAASPRQTRETLHAAERCQERAGDLRGARLTARKMLLACGPRAVARCRAQALALWKRLANPAPRDARLAALARRVASTDACLARAEAQARSGKPPDACLAAADRLYRGLRDELMRARVALVRARDAARKDAPSAERLLAAAADACTASRCAAIRQQALDLYAGWAGARGKLETVLELRLRQDAISAESLPPEKRRYARSARVDAACAAVDAQDGGGSCRALEKRTMGSWTFHDWSAQDFPGDLPKEMVLRANDDFAPTLQACFREQARRLPVPSSVRYPVRWMVSLDGRAEEVHLDPPGDDSGPLAACLRARFATWRYPRSHGENQHVEQSFTVTATAH